MWKRRHLVQQFIDKITYFTTAEIATQRCSGKLKKIIEKNSWMNSFLLQVYQKINFLASIFAFIQKCSGPVNGSSRTKQILDISDKAEMHGAIYPSRYFEKYLSKLCQIHFASVSEILRKSMCRFHS